MLFSETEFCPVDHVLTCEASSASGYLLQEVQSSSEWKGYI